MSVVTTPSVSFPFLLLCLLLLSTSLHFQVCSHFCCPENLNFIGEADQISFFLFPRDKTLSVLAVNPRLASLAPHSFAQRATIRAVASSCFLLWGSDSGASGQLYLACDT